MSTGPGPTRKADGKADDSSVEEIADLLVENEAPASSPGNEDTPHDNFDVMLETPGPMVASSFMPPPPSPVGDTADEGEGAEEAGGGTNLAYEDLLAKLVLPAKAPEPAPEMPALVGSLPMPAPDGESAGLATPAFGRSSAHSLQVAPPAEERTLVTDNPLIAEEQEAAYREGRTLPRDQPVLPPQPAAGAVVAKSKLVYLMLGGLLVLGGMILAVLVLKLLLPTPTTQPTPVVVPAAPPPPAAPAHVVPLPPSAAAPAVVPIPAEPPAAAVPPIPEVAPSEPERPAPKVHRPSGHTRPTHQAAPKAPKPSAPKASAPPAAPKPSKGKKASKTTSLADPFDN